MSNRPTGRLTSRSTGRTGPGRARLALALAALLGGGALTALPAQAAPAADGLSVQYRTSAAGATADQTEPWLKVRNTGSSPSSSAR